MKSKILFFGAMLLSVLVTSCREQSDVLLNYSVDDKLVYNEASNSYAGKFKVLWKALDQNYGIWDYERDVYGVDWDAVYDEFLPKYEALDQRTDVTDVELGNLLAETVAPLHDGHFVAQMQNHQTHQFVAASPSNSRNRKTRDDIDVAAGFAPDLSGYYPASDGGNGDIVEYMEASPKENASLHPVFTQYPVNIKYALFKNNIVYLYISDFYLLPYMSDEGINELFSDASADVLSIAKGVSACWKKWFDKVQELHASGQLRGVIIDLRSNGGGIQADFQYILGSLVPSGGFELGSLRFKRGVGRYDYSPLIPNVFKTLDQDHATLTEPIVALANSQSVSMAEYSSFSVQSLSNGYVIGKQTHGGMSGLNATPSDYSVEYAGITGVRNQTPVWLYTPIGVFVDNQGNIREGIGVIPDIEVSFDTALKTSERRDTQLERAIQFLNTGK